jgi:hypothetical protein
MPSRMAAAPSKASAWAWLASSTSIARSTSITSPDRRACSRSSARPRLIGRTMPSSQAENCVVRQVSPRAAGAGGASALRRRAASLGFGAACARGRSGRVHRVAAASGLPRRVPPGARIPRPVLATRGGIARSAPRSAPLPCDRRRGRGIHLRLTCRHVDVRQAQRGAQPLFVVRAPLDQPCSAQRGDRVGVLRAEVLVDRLRELVERHLGQLELVAQPHLVARRPRDHARLLQGGHLLEDALHCALALRRREERVGVLRAEVRVDDRDDDPLVDDRASSSQSAWLAVEACSTKVSPSARAPVSVFVASCVPWVRYWKWIASV